MINKYYIKMFVLYFNFKNLLVFHHKLILIFIIIIKFKYQKLVNYYFIL